MRLAELLPSSAVTGVTISSRQVELARGFARKRGLGARCRFVLGDFQDISFDDEYDVAVSIEAAVHAERPERFFRAAAAALRPGGRLVIVDDFLARPEAELDDAGRRRTREFTAGWRLSALTTPAEATGVAAEHDFTLESDEDLTALVRLGRPRDRVIAMLVPLFRAVGLVGVPFFGNMIGGDALQRGLRAGDFAYRMLVYRCGG